MNQHMQTSQGTNVDPSQLGQVQMTQVPDVLTTKDMSYLSDMLSWNLLATKKAHFYAQQCWDPEIKQALEAACTMHQTHYQRLLQHMGTHMKSNTH